MQNTAVSTFAREHVGLVWKVLTKSMLNALYIIFLPPSFFGSTSILHMVPPSYWDFYPPSFKPCLLLLNKVLAFSNMPELADIHQGTESSPVATSVPRTEATPVNGTGPPDVGPHSHGSNDTFLEPENPRKAPRVDQESLDHSHGNEERPLKLPPTWSCIACQEDQKPGEVIEAVCGHHYCRTCVEQLVQTALDDYRYLPCRCCREPIPFALLKLLSPADLAKAYETRLAEAEMSKHTVCHDTKCGVVIPPANRSGDLAYCPSCAATTCVTCKKAGHGSNDCPDNTTSDALLAIALNNAWQRCHGCKALVEKNEGCNHMT